MDIVLCGECGFLGNNKELKMFAATPKNEFTKKIIEKNNLCCKICPMCNSSLLYYKNNDVLSHGATPINKRLINPSPQVDHDDNFEDIDPEIDNDFDISETIMNDVVPKKKFRSPKTYKKEICDNCRKEFESRYGSTKCEECLKNVGKEDQDGSI